ncbi:hypothetical protein VNI00_003798 [Paramarasmius palmivorus]|uniref:Uncharacterized protein n=1 Tax=Paramarasmius palmivorus TaxID=297713 RepID=A0AAW0DN62_9AGAR
MSRTGYNKASTTDTRSAAWETLSLSNRPFCCFTALGSTRSTDTAEDVFGFPTGDANVLYQKAQSIPEIRERCRLLGVKSILNPRVAEEQEREVNHEIEREPQKQRPLKAQAVKHHVHDHVRKFVESGRIPPNSPVFTSIFVSLKDGTSNVRGLVESMAPGHRLDLFATYDFLTTVQSSLRSNDGDYIRPVNWLLTGKDGILVALSPYEINELLPRIRISENVNLHIYTPRTTQDMNTIDHLKLYCIPSLPLTWKAPSQTTIDLLNLAAGQLYFSDYEGYLRVCALLGICTPEDQKQADMRVQADGFIRPEDRVGRVRDTCIFDKSPLPYLKVLTGFRRKGQTYSATHLGKILDTRFLHRDMFD